MNKDMITEENRGKPKIKGVKSKINKLKKKELEAKLLKYQMENSENVLNSTGLFGTAKEPRKSMSSFLRNQNKFEVANIAILDRKAAVLIRICTTVISVLIGFSEYINQNVNQGRLISILLITGLLVTLVLSILATKPFGFMIGRFFKKHILNLHPKLEENTFLMGDVNLGISEYEKAMQHVVKSQDLQIGNQVRANYLISQSNTRKSVLVDYAYDALLLTFVLTGIVFLLNELVVV